jgi:hypothetical protein
MNDHIAHTLKHEKRKAKMSKDPEELKNFKNRVGKVKFNKKTTFQKAKKDINKYLPTLVLWL